MRSNTLSVFLISLAMFSIGCSKSGGGGGGSSVSSGTTAPQAAPSTAANTSSFAYSSEFYAGTVSLLIYSTSQDTVNVAVPSDTLTKAGALLSSQSFYSATIPSIVGMKSVQYVVNALPRGTAGDFEIIISSSASAIPQILTHSKILKQNGKITFAAIDGNTKVLDLNTWTLSSYTTDPTALTVINGAFGSVTTADAAAVSAQYPILAKHFISVTSENSNINAAAVAAAQKALDTATAAATKALAAADKTALDAANAALAKAQGDLTAAKTSATDAATLAQQKIDQANAQAQTNLDLANKNLDAAVQAKKEADAAKSDLTQANNNLALAKQAQADAQKTVADLQKQLDSLLNPVKINLTASGINDNNIGSRLQKIGTQVTALNLSRNKFSKLPSMTRFTNLKYLNLSHTKINGYITKISTSDFDLKALTSLTSLNLSHTAISNASSLENIFKKLPPNLTSLDLRGLVGAEGAFKIPELYDGIPKLTSLTDVTRLGYLC